MQPQKKIGRPLKADKPLSVELKIRIDEDTNNDLKEFAERNNTTKVETVRTAIKKYLKDNTEQ